MYLMVYVECLKDYINQGIRNYYLRDYIYDLFHELDEMSKIELVDNVEKRNIQEKRKLTLKCLDACLKGKVMKLKIQILIQNVVKK